MIDRQRGQTHAVIAISNRQLVARLEIAVTSRRQGLRANSNRRISKYVGSIPHSFRAVSLVPREFLSATQPNSKNRTTP
jgi:hypothetical protein